MPCCPARRRPRNTPRDRTSSRGTGTSDLFRPAQADGDLAPDRDPAFEAAWLIALWDGLQIQWLYDRSAVNVSEELADHLARVLPR